MTKQQLQDDVRFLQEQIHSKTWPPNIEGDMINRLNAIARELDKRLN